MDIARPDFDHSRDENELRRIYGKHTVLSHVGVFTLVHCDRPSPETVERRIAEFDPSAWYVDSCPLCEMSRRHGGVLVFDSRDIDEEEPTDDVPEPDPLCELATALSDLEESSDRLVTELEDVAEAALLARAIETIAFLHDRIADAMTGVASPVSLTDRLAAAFDTIDAIQAAHPELAPPAQELLERINALAALWRSA